jgi:hypothetical protein
MQCFLPEDDYSLLVSRANLEQGHFRQWKWSLCRAPDHGMQTASRSMLGSIVYVRIDEGQVAVATPQR